jgi:integrase
VRALTAAEAVEQYAREAGSKRARLVSAYLAWAGSFKRAREDATLAAYLRELLEGGKARGTVDLHYRTIRAWFRRFGLAPPTDRTWRYNQRDAARPALTRDAVEALVAAAVRGETTPRTAACLFFATVYGMRAGELAAIAPEDIDRAGRRVFVRTEKKGIQRWCWLPPEADLWLPATWKPITDLQANSYFRAAWDAAMPYERPPRTAWHAVRRAVVQAFRSAGIPGPDTERFLRWAGDERKSSSERMRELYESANVLVGARGVERARPEDEGRREYDAAVWDRHPLLPLWRPAPQEVPDAQNEKRSGH